MTEITRRVLKLMYRMIPFKKQFFTLIKAVWRPPYTISKHLHFKGVIRIPIESGRVFKIRHYGYILENELFWEGLKNRWERFSVGLWIKLCKNATVIFDIGANTGVYSLIAKTVQPNANVFAFEPVARIFEKLKANVDLNGYDITCINKALSDHKGMAQMFIPDAEHSYTATINKSHLSPDQNFATKDIEVLTLESFVTEHEIRHVDLVKIDVEKHEPEVLSGFGRCLSSFRPTLLIEILTDEIGQRVETMTKSLGYLYFNIDEERGIRQVSSITRSDSYNYLLCSPETARSVQLL